MLGTYLEGSPSCPCVRRAFSIARGVRDKTGSSIRWRRDQLNVPLLGNIQFQRPQASPTVFNLVISKVH